MESADHHQKIDAKDLSLVPDLVLPPKFKMPEFKKYNGTNCPEAHITMFCRRMTGYVNNDQLLIHCFQDSLVGEASKWITLQNMEKKSNESFRQYTQRWREVAIQVQPPLLEKETTMLFINTLKAPFITHMLGSATKSFSNIVMTGEMIENVVRSGKIELGESARKSVPRKRDNEVNNTSTFNKGQSKSFTINQPKMVTTNQQSPESNARKNTERPQFTPIPMTIGSCTEHINAHVVSPFYLEPLQPPYPKWHSIENCTAFKKVVERLIKVGIVRFDNSAMPNVAGNPLPNHTNQGVNGISEGKNKKIKCEVVKFKTLLRQVWREMVMRGLIALDLGRESKEERNYCEFHNEVGHEIQECVEFRALVQNMINNKEIEFYEETKNPVEGDICASEGESMRPAVFLYKDSKRVPWNYDCNVTIPGKESLVDTLKKDQDRGSYTRSWRRYDTASEKAQPVKGKALVVKGVKEKATKSELSVNELVNEEEAKEFLKFLKHSEYSMVEQLRKQPARISVLALLLSSEVHRSALMKVLNETYVANDISVNKLDRLVSNISVDNYIFFNDDEIPPGGMGSTKALHITIRCKGYTLPVVLIDNGSALNVLPLTTLNRLPVDSSHMKECQNIVKAFDGTERKVIGRIERPWIHLAGAVPSSLHQKLKLVSEGRLITINAEEDIIATVSNNAPYLGTDDEAIECSFRSLEFVNATFIAEGSKILVPKLSKTTRMSLQLTIGKEALPGSGLGRHLQGRVETPMPKDKRDRFGLGFKSNAKQRRRELGKKQERRRARLTGEEIKWEPMTFPHISKTFVSGGIIHPERDTPMTRAIEERLESLDINVICEEETEERICRAFASARLEVFWTTGLRKRFL
ncbi:uncharacterized protein LOC108451034 [Gossypium arboreum]|uniref:uncharacterized protein LOC108451034 n=1 Tax=Gossypium arboreum TaxID=29729 RepID=UPI0022F19AF7|nr:uncharacterized protein LOC108451034 [Gossypium arboreum]